jgi:alkylation response protein AidB-like acyl-CoA dehydrogenase
MDFGLSETEEMVRSSAREFLSREAGPELARTAWDAGSDRAAVFWGQVCEMGWPGLAISEDFGGAGMGLMPLAVLMEQWGAHMAPGPLFESAVLAAPLIEAAASDRLKREILPGIADGSQPVTVAVLEAPASWLPDAVRATAVRTRNGWAVTGTKQFVTYADRASKLIVAARTGEQAEEISLFVIDRDADGISTEPVKHASGGPVYTVSLNETPVGSSQIIGKPGEAWPLVTELMLRGAAFRAVQLAGLGQAAFDMTVGYVKERKQFGRPVGSFQAIQHTLADMAVVVKSVRHQAYRAAWSIAQGSPGALRDVARAKYSASTLIPDLCWKAHQSHGAIGFTWEHGLHLYTRHALAWRAEFGDAAWHNRALAEAVGI